MSLRSVKKEISESEENANNLADSVKLYMGENESLTYEGKVIATWKSNAKGGRTFLLKSKVLDELEQKQENDNG